MKSVLSRPKSMNVPPVTSFSLAGEKILWSTILLSQAVVFAVQPPCTEVDLGLQAPDLHNGVGSMSESGLEIVCIVIQVPIFRIH